MVADDACLCEDAFSAAYGEFLESRYDCVGRIILNAYFPMGCTPGGFRTWWRALDGSDDNLDNNHLMRLAGRFSRRVRGWAKSEGIPLIDCAAGERKHDLAERYLPTDPSKTGIFLVLVNRAPWCGMWFALAPVPHPENCGVNYRHEFVFKNALRA